MDHAFRLLVFDLDGTLVDSQYGIAHAMGEAFVEAGFAAPTQAAVREVIGLKLELAVARLLPAEEPARLAAEIAEGYKRAYYAWRRHPAFHQPLFPGIATLLEALDRAEVFLGIATGKGRRGLETTLAHHRLRAHFTTLQTADDGPSKPHPEILHRAMDEIGAAPEETALIGDTVFDMEMARAAGTHALGVAWGYHPASELLGSGAHRVAETVEELPGHLAALRGAEA
jgi:phosphoglycolate phosphatase